MCACGDLFYFLVARRVDNIIKYLSHIHLPGLFYIKTTVHCIQCTVQCTVYSVRRTHYAVHSTAHSVYETVCIVYAVDFVSYIVRRTMYIVMYICLHRNVQ